jgi:hypothetical protein
MPVNIEYPEVSVQSFVSPWWEETKKRRHNDIKNQISVGSMGQYIGISGA